MRIKYPKRHKYNAKKVVINGIEFDSKKEAKRYLELKILEKAGKIKDLQFQPVFLLQEGFKRKITHRAITYRADFEYVDEKGNRVVEDVKGVKTPVFKIKKKLFLKKYRDVIFRVLKFEKGKWEIEEY